MSGSPEEIASTQLQRPPDPAHIPKVGATPHQPGSATSQEQARKPTTFHERAERPDLRAYFLMRIGAGVRVDRRISGDGRDQRATTDTVIVGVQDSEVLLDGRD
jgi:hypothetical protein